MTNEIEPHILEKYEIKKRLGKGAYGIVWKVVDKKTQEVVALKKIFDAFRNKTDAQRTFREIAFLKQFHGHPNIIKLYNVLKAENDKDIYLTFEFMETDLHNVIKRGNILKDVHKQYIMYQLLKATKYLHSANVIHRDQKPSNVLLDSDCFVKLCDFGLARSLSERDSVNPNQNLPPLTEYVATRWYRAPEILMASHRYTKGVDMWSLGCILGEMILGKALFPGKSTMNQIDLIMTYIPKPDKEDIETMLKVYRATMVTKVNTRPRRTLEELIPNADHSAMDLIIKLLQFNPDKRCTIEEALSHQYVKRFHNPAEEISMGHDIIPPVDDDIQLSVEEYRSKLYKFIMQNKAQKKARKRASAKNQSADQEIMECASSTYNQSRPNSNSIQNSSMTGNRKVGADHQANHDSIMEAQLHKATKDYGQASDSIQNNSYHSSFNEAKPDNKQDFYSGYSSSSVNLPKENKEERNRIGSGMSKVDRNETHYQTNFKTEIYNQETLPQYASLLESSAKLRKNQLSGTYSSSKNQSSDNILYDKLSDYPREKSNFNSTFILESRIPSGNELKKSEAVRKAEHDLYRKSTFSPGNNNAIPLHSTYSHYPSYNDNNIYKQKASAEKYNDGINARPRSRTLRASYSNFNLAQDELGSYGNKMNSYNGYPVNNKSEINLKSRGSFDNLTETNHYRDETIYKRIPRNDSRERNNNNISNNNSNERIGTYGLDSRPVSRGLNSTWYGSEKPVREISYFQSESKRHQSAPIGYSSTINGATRPPTSNLGIKDSSKPRGQIYSDYNNRMMSRAKTPSSKLERNKTVGSYYRSNSPGVRYLASDYNQRPLSKNARNYDNNSRYSQTFGSVSNNQLAHYYSRKWIS